MKKRKAVTVLRGQSLSQSKTIQPRKITSLLIFINLSFLSFLLNLLPWHIKFKKLMLNIIQMELYIINLWLVFQLCYHTYLIFLSTRLSILRQIVSDNVIATSKHLHHLRVDFVEVSRNWWNTSNLPILNFVFGKE